MLTNPSLRTQTNVSKINVIVHNKVQIGNTFKFKLYSWTKIAAMKQQICEQSDIPVTDVVLIFKNFELSKLNQDLEYYGIKNQSAIYLVPKIKSGHITPYDILSEGSKAQTKFNKIKWAVDGALNAKIIPKLTDFGTSGTYILLNTAKQPLALFKAQDEEPFAPNNPRGFQGKFGSQGLRSGVLSGEGVDREVAAFLLSESVDNYHQVPITTFIDIYHPSFKSNDHLIYDGETGIVELKNEHTPKKRGSFQIYKKHNDNVGNYGNSLFSTDQVQRIAILDLRILNCDRNEENILVKKKKIINSNKKSNHTYDFQLIPIDHGYSLPDSFNTCQDEVVWFHWDQIKQPLTNNAIECINKIDPIKDVQLIRSKLKFREICLRNLRIAEMVLIAGVQKGLTLYQISQLMFREDSEIISPLEKCVQQSEEYYKLDLPIPTSLVNGIKLKFQKFGYHSHHSDKKENDFIKQLSMEQNQALQQNFILKLKTICEEQEITVIDQDEKLLTNDNLKMNQYPQQQSNESSPACKIKRSTSQPNLNLNNGRNGIKQKHIYSEKFFQYFKIFLQNMVDIKCKEMNQDKKRHRFRSQDITQI